MHSRQNVYRFRAKMNTDRIKVARRPRATSTPPRWVWWLALGGSGLVALVTALAALVLARGAADPPVAGPVRWSDEDLVWAGGPEVVLDAGRELWAAAPPDGAITFHAFTISVRAVVAAASDPAAAWGVWLEVDDGSRVVYAITSADGGSYVTTRRCPVGDSLPDLDACPAMRPDWRWSPYPRIEGPGAANTITLHREPSGAVRLRVNDERLGAASVTVSGQWGVWARGGDGSSGVTWERAEVR